jgi:spore coat polysaccharide biosynthesis protein SpsF (cytidylyltransferase family)
MNPKQLHELVVDATANDYESFKQIREYVNDEQQLVDDELILSALEHLTNAGEITCFSYSHEARKFLPKTFNRDLIDELWFSSR